MPYLSRFGSYWEKLKNGCKSLKHRWISRERGINENCGKTRKSEKPWKNWQNRPCATKSQASSRNWTFSSPHYFAAQFGFIRYSPGVLCRLNASNFPLKFFRSSLSQLMHHQFTFASNRVRPTSHTHYRVIRWSRVRNQQLYNVYHLILIGGILPCKSVMVSYNNAMLRF